MRRHTVQCKIRASVETTEANVQVIINIEKPFSNPPVINTLMDSEPIRESFFLHFITGCRG